MAAKISPEDLRSTLEGTAPFALIDVREPAEYNSSHIPGSSLIPRRLLEFQMAAAVPYPGVRVVLCDDAERRAALAAVPLVRIGHTQV
ncbi:MAG: rhodanese-like domain-containing protein, partial [Chloroflexi bacterium]|nr:rhodanese-like domain-containing protein [Chloroflexota bacterium]